MRNQRTPDEVVADAKRLKAAVARARREERERCAKAVESLITRSLLTGEGTSYDGVRAAVSVIRALPDEESK